MLIDTHTHLAHFGFDREFSFLTCKQGEIALLNGGSRPLLLRQMQSSGICACVEPAISIETNEQLLALAKAHSGYLFPAVGVHPTRTYAFLAVDPEGRRVEKKLHWRQRK